MNFKSPVSERLRSRFATPRTRVRIPSGLPSIGYSTMVVHRTVNATVAGSNPATRAKYGHGIKAVPWTPNPEMSVRIRLSVPISSGVVSQKGSELSSMGNQEGRQHDAY